MFDLWTKLFFPVKIPKQKPKNKQINKQFEHIQTCAHSPISAWNFSNEYLHQHQERVIEHRRPNQLQQQHQPTISIQWQVARAAQYQLKDWERATFATSTNTLFQWIRKWNEMKWKVIFESDVYKRTRGIFFLIKRQFLKTFIRLKQKKKQKTYDRFLSSTRFFYFRFLLPTFLIQSIDVFLGMQNDWH